MPIIGVIEPAYHKCRPEYTSYPTYTAYQCDTCGRLWVLQDDERGQLAWQRPNWWQRGKIKKLIAVERKTVADSCQFNVNVSGSTHLPRDPSQRPFIRQPSFRLSPGERQTAMRGAASE